MRMLTRGEWILLGKIVFILVAAMLLITVRNAVTLPGEQFIYGRF